MPEHHIKEQVLGGDTTITPSSDEAIIAKIKGLGQEIGGLPDPEVVIEGEALDPKVVTLPFPGITSKGAPTNIIRTNPFSSNDSSFGRVLQEERTEKKAA